MFGRKLYRGGNQPSPAPGSKSSVAIVPVYPVEEERVQEQRNRDAGGGNVSAAIMPMGFAQWMEANGASVEVSYALGKWSVTVGWCALISYGDDRGTHREEWSVSRHGVDLHETMRLAIGKAINVSAESEP